MFSLAAQPEASIACSWCSDGVACVRCVDCNALFCAACDLVLHKPKNYKSHTRTATVAHASDVINEALKEAAANQLDDEAEQRLVKTRRTSSLSVPASPEPAKLVGRPPVRVYIDGCFDLMHSGHFNAIRQAKALGDILVVGVHSDEEITRNKGPPVINERERYALVEACKWVDEMVPDVPYSVNLELLDKLNCDFCVHGDDTAINANGEDAYGLVKAAGRMKIVKRTEGVSTTDMVGRLLLMTKEHLATTDSSKPVHQKREAAISQFLPTTRRIMQFANGKAPQPTDRIVYIDGAFDLFHIGHADTLKKAKELGDFLIVGVHDDESVNEHKGSNYPVMNLHERVLNVLACKYVDEVIIGAPWVITKDLITSMNISVVVQGSNTKLESPADSPTSDPYEIPKTLGIYTEVSSSYDLTTETIVERIIENRLRYVKRNQVREAKELTYIQNKTFVEEV
eukprot:GILI01006429.1.p1 GENE.GILI01006429.1~~GILI01006429.1.p1  ORF type:complete len:456 (+),score=118.35 GILI01006429.1:45-1412(+)